MLIASAEIDGFASGARELRDVRIDAGRIVAIERHLEPERNELVIDAAGGALIRGLHDHHLHLFALAAAGASVRCGPPEVRSHEQLQRVLHEADGERVRGVAYHESVAGDLDRCALDRLVPDRPLRIQHRSGALWMLNSRALAELGLDASGSGRLFHADRALRERGGRSAFPSLAAVGERLARYGVVGVTDATVHNADAELAALVRAHASGELPQRVVVMGARALPVPEQSGVSRGCVKLVLRDADLPDLEALRDEVQRAHADGRGVAVHCVTRAELVLALEAIALAGPRPGDRIEHASVAPPECVERIAELGLSVVTQPGFIRERGDAYATEVDARDRPWLYRARGWLAARVPLGAGTDAPFGDPDPWLAMRAAVERRTLDGREMTLEEALTPEAALALFQSRPGAPGEPPQPLAVGDVADLCLLDRPWADARDSLSHEHVRATLRAGEWLGSPRA